MKQNVIDDYNLLSGQQKAAILMMSLDEDKSAQIFALMDDEEIKELSVIMASLGKVNSNVVEQLFQEFAEKSSNTGTLIGTFESTERLLSKTLDKDRVSAIMEEISGPAGRTMWDKLGNVNEHVLANYLKTNIRRRLRLFSLRLRQNMPRRLSPCCRRTLRWKSSCACCGWIRCRKRCWTVWKNPAQGVHVQPVQIDAPRFPRAYRRHFQLVGSQY